MLVEFNRPCKRNIAEIQPEKTDDTRKSFITYVNFPPSALHV